MNKINFQRRTERVINSLQGRPTLLLQCCCGPCSSYVLEYLREYFDLTVLFFNPNIQPEAEYHKRFEHFRKVTERFPVKLMDCQYDGQRFEQAVKGLENEPEEGARCTVCFALRLEETAKLAKEHGFDYFCTTLSISPHKNAELLNEIGEIMAKRYGVKWLPSDFKKRGGYERSLELSAQLELYRQDYCGCRWSHNKAAVGAEDLAGDE